MVVYVPDATPSPYVTGGFSLNGCNYPRDWLDKADPNQLLDLNIVEPPEYDSTTHMLIYTNDPMDPFDLQPVPAVDINQVREAAYVTIDNAAGNARVKYITSVPGQEVTYLEKEKEARAWLLDPEGDYIFLTNESTKTGIPISDLVDLILYTSATWRNLAAVIEGIRRGGKVAIEHATTVEDITQIETDTLNQLAAF